MSSAPKIHDTLLERVFLRIVKELLRHVGFWLRLGFAYKSTPNRLVLGFEAKAASGICTVQVFTALHAFDSLGNLWFLQPGSGRLPSDKRRAASEA
jgi:hypothetical protein